VLSSHADPIPFLADLDDRIEADATVGAIDSAAFVATTIDSAVTSYFKGIDEIEEAVEHLDARALTRTDGSDVLVDLVALRRRIARLRRVLSSQRDVFAAFRTPDFGVMRPARAPRRSTRSPSGSTTPSRAWTTAATASSARSTSS
jgi:Mg2+ and Co2+ transporter CorA